jgi:hypothetical protein
VGLSGEVPVIVGLSGISRWSVHTGYYFTYMLAFISAHSVIRDDSSRSYGVTQVAIITSVGTSISAKTRITYMGTIKALCWFVTELRIGA